MDINKVGLIRHGELSYGNYPTKIILHHADMNGSVTDINQVHLNKGWCMIGYNYYIRKDATVWEGRPVDAIGAHCYGQNATSIGICFEGNFMTDQMSDAQYNAGVELCRYLMQKYPNIKEIGGHKKYCATDCPGCNFPLDKMIAAAFYNTKTVEHLVCSSDLIKLWDSGDKVKDVQEKLIKLGYSLYGGADGIFGQSTYDAVEAFQSSHGLSVDGIVGKDTLSALNSAVSVKTSGDINTYKFLQHELNVQCSAGLSEDNIPGPKTLAACPTVGYGAQGNITKWIQSKLGINADGIFGRQTLVAVQNFQAGHGLSADGIVGVNTWKALLGL